MSDVKALDVCARVLKRDGTPFREPDIDDRGYVITVSGASVPPNGLTSGDPPNMLDRTVGDIINKALDAVSDKLAPEERRKRFTLSCRIEDAMREGEPLAMSPDDETRIKAAAELIVGNHMLLARIEQAVFAAEKPKPLAKANGAFDDRPAIE